jgi:hypothetical protein
VTCRFSSCGIHLIDEIHFLEVKIPSAGGHFRQSGMASTTGSAANDGTSTASLEVATKSTGSPHASRGPGVLTTETRRCAPLGTVELAGA